MKTLDAAIINMLAYGIKEVRKSANAYDIRLNYRTTDIAALRVTYFTNGERVQTYNHWYDNSTPECMYVKLALSLYLNVDPETFFPDMKRYT